MSHFGFLNYTATFLTALAAFIIIGFSYLSLSNSYNNIKVIEPLVDKFKVIDKTVRPGQALFYEINYYKHLDLPGDLTKLLIVTPKNGKKQVYVPLPGVSGHLPTGKIEGTAFVRIPENTPEGTGKIKMTAVYNYGNCLSQPVVVYTEDFEITK